MDFNHAITGVGGKLTRIVGKLQDVPLSLGTRFNEPEAVLTTFYVVDNQAYHWILGLPLLASVHGKVLCHERILEFTSLTKDVRQLPLITRTQSRSQPAYGTFRADSPHLEAFAVFDGWPDHWETESYSDGHLESLLRQQNLA